MPSARLLLIGSFAPGDLAESYARAFEQCDVEVFRFDSDRAYVESTRLARHRVVRRLLRPSLWRHVNRATIAVTRTVRPHAVVAFKGAYLEADTVRLLQRELGIPFVNYYPDNPFCGVPLNPRKTSAQRRDLLDVLQEYARVWTWAPPIVEQLRTRGVRAAYLPFGVDEELYRPDAPRPSVCGECAGDHAIVFVGQHSDAREAHIDAIRSHTVALWGNRWTRARRRFDGRHAIHGGAMTGAVAASAYRTATVALNIVDDLNMPGHNMRTFEVPASGGLMLSRYTPEQAAFFPENEAAVYYRDPAELDECLTRVRADTGWAARLRERAVAIAREHTYRHRARAILSELAVR
jgi:spore maturation protein CgeB